MMSRYIIIIAFTWVWNLNITAQVNFNRGVNLTNWFQEASARQIQFTKYTRDDFVQIKSLGCDVIRLPINLHAMTNGSPDYTLDPLFLEFLDKAVTWAEELQINLILDNHTFSPDVNTDLNIGTILNKVWKQMAQHYKDRSEYILYEILNEPHGITTAQWGAIQKGAIDAIRSVDTKHTIIVGASGFNTYSELKDLPVYSDSKLIYTFHFYDPFIFTHQGASWGSPSMVPLAGVPFPYNSASMPACPASLKGTWVESNLNSYSSNGTDAKVKSLIDIAVNFKTSRNVKVFCGEFGVYIPNSPNADRVYWYEVVRKYLEEKGIPWTIWDYNGGFGLFKKDSNEQFDYDLNTEILQSLGFTVPPQKTFILRPDSVGFPMYTDLIENKITGSGANNATIDFYNDNKPNNGKYCLYWGNAPQYSNITFKFNTARDFSKLVSEGYALDFIVRGMPSTAKFDIRFIDTKTSDPADHPWRMRISVDNTRAAWDKYWHHVHVPLSAFTEQGSWDNNSWYNPEGKFDWKAIDRMEIVAEQESLTGKNFWFDNIHITNKDTAIVRENSIISKRESLTEENKVLIYPNPMSNYLHLSYKLGESEYTKIEIFNMTGKKVFENAGMQPAGDYNQLWNGRDMAGNVLPSGLYLLNISFGKTGYTFKIFVNPI